MRASRVALFNEKVSPASEADLDTMGNMDSCSRVLRGKFANDSASIALAQSLFKGPSTLSGLVAIGTDFSLNPTTITALVEHGLSLEESTTLVE